MEITVSYNDVSYLSDLSKPLDISIPLGKARCFYAPPVKMQPFVSGDFIGSVKKGAPVNFYNVELNPHGNGTHTESLGHITRKQESIGSVLKNFHFIAQLVTVPLMDRRKDKVITVSKLKQQLPQGQLPEALIIRTSPNPKSKLTKDYSGTNPPYLDKKAMAFLVKAGIKHLLIDLPSVDREVDNGILAAHHLFWQVGNGFKKSEARKSATITELIYVANRIKDGLYLLNLQVAPLELDAAPSRPVLYKLVKK